MRSNRPSSPARRRFLKLAAQCGVAGLIAHAAARRAEALPLGRAGIQLYAVKDALLADPARTLKAIRTIGFREVEAAGYANLSVSEFRQLLSDAGLSCPSAHLQFDMENLGAAFEQAHTLGAHYAVSGSLRATLAVTEKHASESAGTQTPTGMGVEEAKRTAEIANQIGAAAKPAGLQYAYHNHDFEFADQGAGVIGYDILLKETDPKLVKFEIDCGWMVLGGRDPRDYFARYPKRVPMIHVKDFLPTATATGAANESVAHPGAELGHGMIDYRPILAVAEKSGLKHYFAEQEGPFERMSELQAARQAYDYLRALP
jgi:sugar phosphate isomerase/epimerase